MLFDLTRLKHDEEAHTYFYDGQPLINVTTLIEEEVRKPFDRQGQAAKTATRTGHTVEEVLAQWEAKRVEAATRGKAVHTAINNRLDGYEVTESQYPEFRQWLKWYEAWQSKIKIIAVEQIAYSLDYMLAGRFDALFHIEGHGNVLIDWKTGKFNSFGFDRMKAPFADRYDSTAERYAIQLAMYRSMIEQHTDTKVDETWVIHLEKDRFSINPREDLTQIVHSWLMQRTAIPF